MRYKKMFLTMFFFIFFVSCPIVYGDAVDTIENNLGVEASNIILLILTCGVVVIVAFDARIALMIAFLLYASLFIVFTLATEAGYGGFDPYFSGVAMMACFVLLALSLLVTYKKANSPPSGIA